MCVASIPAREQRYMYRWVERWVTFTSLFRKKRVYQIWRCQRSLNKALEHKRQVENFSSFPITLNFHVLASQDPTEWYIDGILFIWACAAARTGKVLASDQSPGAWERGNSPGEKVKLINWLKFNIILENYYHWSNFLIVWIKSKVLFD